MLINCLAACAHLTITVSEIQRDIGRKSSIFSYPLAFDAPVRGVSVGIAPPRLVRKTIMAWIPHGVKISKISLFVLAQLTNVRDGRTDRRTNRHRMPAIAALCIASHGKNYGRTMQLLNRMTNVQTDVTHKCANSLNIYSFCSKCQVGNTLSNFFSQQRLFYLNDSITFYLLR